MGAASSNRPGKGLTRRQFSATALAAGLAASAGLAQGRQPLPILRIVESGHSLTDGIMVPLDKLINEGGGRGTTLVKCTVPGSPIEIRWKDPSAWPDIRLPEIMAKFDVMVNTERVALSGTYEAHDSPGYALKFFDHAWTYGREGKGAASLLYSTWVSIDSGPDYENPYKDQDGLIPFRERLDREAVQWEAILDHVNQYRTTGSPAMKMIPGTQVMAAAYDEIGAGKAPGISDFRQLFDDDIHVSLWGGYLIALAHYAVIYNRDPHGLPHGVPSKGGTSKEQAEWMQDLVWRVVTGYSRAMTDGSGKLEI